MKGQARKSKTSVVEQVRRELRANRGDWPRLSKLTGGKISYRWLIAFAAGTIREPSFTRLVSLASYLGFRIEVLPGKHFAKFTPE